jgi:hypothetical protein
MRAHRFLAAVVIATPLHVQPDGTERVPNPYQHAQVYVDPEWARQVRDQAAATGGDLGEQMSRVAGPTAARAGDVVSVGGDGEVLDPQVDTDRAGGEAVLSPGEDDEPELGGERRASGTRQ